MKTLLLNRSDTLRLGECLEMRIVHIALGSYVTPHTPLALPVNRFFSVITNPNGMLNYIAEAGSERHPLEAGTVYYIPADHPVTLKLDQELKFCSVQFNLNLYSAIDIFSGLQEYQTFRDPELITEFAASLKNDAPLQLLTEVKRHTWALAGRILAGMEKNQQDICLRLASWQKILDYIATHCNAELKIADLAKFQQLSVPTFSKKFSKELGLSPKKFVARQLLKRAMEYLNQPEASVKETAEQLRFSDSFVFSRFFKSVSGLSPSEYRSRQGRSVFPAES